MLQPTAVCWREWAGGRSGCVVFYYQSHTSRASMEGASHTACTHITPHKSRECVADRTHAGLGLLGGGVGGSASAVGSRSGAKWLRNATSIALCTWLHARSSFHEGYPCCLGKLTYLYGRARPCSLSCNESYKCRDKFCLFISKRRKNVHWRWRCCDVYVCIREADWGIRNMAWACSPWRAVCDGVWCGGAVVACVIPVCPAMDVHGIVRFWPVLGLA